MLEFRTDNDDFATAALVLFMATYMSTVVKEYPTPCTCCIRAMYHREWYGDEPETNDAS